MIRRLRNWWPRDRRQAQAGTTLVELLVSVVIMGLALTLIVGTFSTGLLNSTRSKRNTAAVAVAQYELDLIAGMPYSGSAQPYSDCFATEGANVPPPTPATGGFGGSCASSYTLRVDVNVSSLSSSTQLWSIAVSSWPAGAGIGKQIQIIKADHR
jgi:MSHA pilin protein MshD